MVFQYETNGVCAKRIDVDVTAEKISSITFIGGCNGSLKAIAKLVEGMSPQAAIEKLSGITCGDRATSCSDQLSKALVAWQASS
ncbi:MAG: TIGR03905 family TSCPD domain-containing protein [Turicibacter sp.]|nr:TIGR03905 family TSCPD domain-containing protein [Turicibacter sp.]